MQGFESAPVVQRSCRCFDAVSISQRCCLAQPPPSSHLSSARGCGGIPPSPPSTLRAPPQLFCLPLQPLPRPSSTVRPIVFAPRPAVDATLFVDAVVRPPQFSWGGVGGLPPPPPRPLPPPSAPRTPWKLVWVPPRPLPLPPSAIWLIVFAWHLLLATPTAAAHHSTRCLCAVPVPRPSLQHFCRRLCRDHPPQLSRGGAGGSCGGGGLDPPPSAPSRTAATGLTHAVYLLLALAKTVGAGVRKSRGE